MLVDWEWSGPGDRLCDLATFCDLCHFDDEAERRALSEYFGEETLLASRGLLAARLKLWRLWFVVRGSLWAAVKAVSRSRRKQEGVGTNKFEGDVRTANSLFVLFF